MKRFESLEEVPHLRRVLGFVFGLLLASFVAYKFGEYSVTLPVPKVNMGDILSAKGTGDADVDAKRPWVELVSWSPRIFVHHNLLTHEECDEIIALTQAKVERSTVVGADGKPVVNEVRSSSGTFIVGSDAHHPLIRDVERRISEWTKLPQVNGEHFYVLKYEIGQQYLPHTDFFNEQDEAQRIHQIGPSGNRVATVLTCLHSPDAGGETIFPRINLNISCVTGNSILFWDSLPDTTSDPMSLHGVALHSKWELLERAVRLVNAEWPRSTQSREIAMRKSNDSLPAHFVLTIDSKGLADLKSLKASLPPRPSLPQLSQPGPQKLILIAEMDPQINAEMGPPINTDTNLSKEKNGNSLKDEVPAAISGLPPPPPRPTKAMPKKERAVTALKSDSETLLSAAKEEFILDESGPYVVIGHLKLSLTLEANALFIESVVIAPSLRGLGLGKVLMARTEDWMITHGFTVAYLNTKDQQSFYERLGYEPHRPISTLGDNAKRFGTGEANALLKAFGGAASTAKGTTSVDAATGETLYWYRKALSAGPST